jgi:diguanylate cyclase (GGDEF)-like protein
MSSSSKRPSSRHARQTSSRPLSPSSVVRLGSERLTLQSLGSQAPVTLWTVDRELRLTSAWGALNLIPERSIGGSPRGFRRGEASVAAHSAEYFRALQGATVNFCVDTARQSFHVTLAPLKDDRLRTIVGVIGVAMDFTDRRKSESEVRHIADHDPLTDLLNYRVLLETLDSELRRSDRTQRPFALLLLDVDSLKAINDRHGHLVGSQVLRRMAATLRKACRSIDTVARYGGDEFAVLLLETDRGAAEGVARRISADLASDSESPPFTASAGVAVFPEDGYTAENVLSAADRGLYRNKLLANLQTRKLASEPIGAAATAAEKAEGADRRRSVRRVLDVPLVISGESSQQEPFREQTFTLSVSAHGALVVLAASVTLGQKLLLRNPASDKETEARVVRFGSPYGGLAQVGLEFARPALDFWAAEGSRCNSPEASDLPGL